MANNKSDVTAKKAFCDELLKRGYDTADVVSSPADIRATKDEVEWFFEIKPQTFCYKNDGQYEYVVKASQAVEEDDYIMVLLSYSSYYGSHHSDAIDGDKIYLTFSRYLTAPVNFVFITAVNHIYTSTVEM